MAIKERTLREHRTQEQVGEGAGSVMGALLGAGFGSLAGPVGTIVGGIGGAVGGWWAGEQVGRTIEDWSEEDERQYRHHFRGLDGLETYEEARVGYMVGHIAGRHPEYRGLTFAEIEPDLQRGFVSGDYYYYALRPYMRAGYERTRRRPA